MTTRAVLTAVLALLLGACTSQSPAPQQPRGAATPVPAATGTLAATATASSSPRPLGARGCRPPSPISERTDGPGLEVQGTATRGQLWGLVFLDDRPIRVGDEVKIVWRMTGQGDLRLTATAPDGTRTPPAWGPETHYGSNYDRPGDEWGAGYRFTQRGCWTLHAARDGTTADVWLTVA